MPRRRIGYLEHFHSTSRSFTMLRQAAAGIVILLLAAGAATAADKEVTGTVVKVDLKASKLIVKTDAGEKTFDVNDETKFIGPKGGASKEGLKDDRLTVGAEVKLLVAGNNRTLREVHLPVRKK
jgi:hypothetical protein